MGSHNIVFTSKAIPWTGKTILRDRISNLDLEIKHFNTIDEKNCRVQKKNKLRILHKFSINMKIGEHDEVAGFLRAKRK